MDYSSHDTENPEGRRGFLRCMAMAGAGTLDRKSVV